MPAPLNGCTPPLVACFAPLNECFPPFNGCQTPLSLLNAGPPPVNACPPPLSDRPTMFTLQTSFKPRLFGGGGVNPLGEVTVDGKGENSSGVHPNYVQEFGLRMPTPLSMNAPPFTRSAGHWYINIVYMIYITAGAPPRISIFAQRISQSV